MLKMIDDLMSDDRKSVFVHNTNTMQFENHLSEN